MPALVTAIGNHGGTASVSSVSVTIPTSPDGTTGLTPAVGDVAVFAGCAERSTQKPTAAAGWTEIRSTLDAGLGVYFTCYYKVLVSGDLGAAHAISVGAARRICCGMTIFRDGGTPVIADTAPASGGGLATITSPNATPAANDAALLGVGWYVTTATPWSRTGTAGSPYTETVDTCSTHPTANNAGLHMGYQILSGGGGASQGGLVSTLSSTAGFAKASSTVVVPAVLVTVTKTLAVSWDVKAPVTKTLAGSWNVLAAVGKTLGASWNVQAAVGKTLAASWNVRAAVGKTLAASWNVRAAVVKTLAASWNVLGTVGKTLAASWNVRAAVGKTLAASWNVRAQVGKTLAVSWDVLGSLTTVVKTLAASWNVRGTVAKTLASSWNVRAAATKSLAASWDVLSNTGVVVVKTLAVSWNVKTKLVKTLAVSWRVRRRVTTFHPVSWNVFVGDPGIRHILLDPGDRPRGRVHVRARVHTAPAYTDADSEVGMPYETYSHPITGAVFLPLIPSSGYNPDGALYEITWDGVTRLIHVPDGGPHWLADVTVYPAGQFGGGMFGDGPFGGI